VRQDDLRHGSGIATFVEPDPKGGTKWAGTYEGQWIKNLKHGKGIFSYANGDKYEGMHHIAMYLACCW